jgi:hypothetical protein
LEPDDEEMMPAPKTKKGPKKPKAKSTVVESSEDEPKVSKKEKHNSLQNASRDTDIEEIPNPKEDPEEELGKLSIPSKIHASHLPRLKKKWPKIGRHLFMAFSSRALKLKLLTVDAATSSSVPHRFAEEKA